jgi:hypothetical protein
MALCTFVMVIRSIIVYCALFIIFSAVSIAARAPDFPDYLMVTQDEANRHLSITTPKGDTQWEIEAEYVNPTLVYYLRGHLMYIENNGITLWRTRVDGKQRQILYEDTRFFPYYTTATDHHRVFVYRTPTNDYRAVMTDGTEVHTFYSPNLIFTPALWSGDEETLYVEVAVDQRFVGNIVVLDVTTGESSFGVPGQVSYGLASDDRFIYQWQRRWRLSDNQELSFAPDTVMLDWLDKTTLLVGYQVEGKWELYSASLDGTMQTKLLDARLPPLLRHDGWLYVHALDNALVRFNLDTFVTETLIENAVIFEEARDYIPSDPLLIYTEVFSVQDHQWIITTMQDGDTSYLVRIKPDGSDRKILHTHHESDTVRLYLSADEQWLILDSLYSEHILRINIESGDTQPLPIEVFLFTIPTFEGAWHTLNMIVGALVVLTLVLVWWHKRSVVNQTKAIAGKH